MRAALLSTTALHTGLRGWREFNPPPADYVVTYPFGLGANAVSVGFNRSISSQQFLGLA